MRTLVHDCFRLVFGTLYPAYASYKAVKTKNVKEYVSTKLYFEILILNHFISITIPALSIQQF